MKIKRIYIVMIIALGIIAISQVKSLLANYNIVEDIVMSVSSNTLNEGETVSLTVTDSNVKDTKIIIPLDEKMEFIESTNQDGSVVFDNVNQQLVIDWIDASNEKKAITITLKVKQEGSYLFKAMTVRNEQEVSTKEEMVEVINFDKSVEDSTQVENSETTESSMIEESTTEKMGSLDKQISGLWGTSPWTFDEDTGVLTIDSGELGSNSPWDYAINPSSSIKKIILTGETIAPIDSSYLFSSRYSRTNLFRSLKSIEGLSYLDTSKVTNMEFMFAYNKLLSNIDTTGFDTSNVTNMSGMFYSCSGFTNLDISGFDTSNVTDMSSMFFRNDILESLDLSVFDTSNMTSMSGMFNGCYKLESLDLSVFDTSNVTDMSIMFSGCRSLESLDVSKFNTSNVTNMWGMFYQVVNLESLNLSGFNTSNVTNMRSMFFQMLNVESLDVSKFDTSKVTNMSEMFYDMRNLKNLDISGFDTSKTTNMDKMFRSTIINKLVLGGSFKFLNNPELKTPTALNEGDRLTGNWIREDGGSIGYSPTDFMANYSMNDLTPGTYVAEVTYGNVKGEMTLTNQTHSDGFFYVNDEVKIGNKINHEGDVWNFIYKTKIPEELTINQESLEGYTITEDGVKVALTNEVFTFDESSRMLEVNLKDISELDGKGNYYSVGDHDFYYELTAVIRKESIGTEIKSDTTISYFDANLKPYPNLNLSTESKSIYGIDPKLQLKKEIKNLSRSEEITAVGDELEFNITATNSEELGAMSTFDLAENSFPNELDFISGSAELILPDGTTKKLPDSVYQPNKQMVSTNVFSGNGYVGVKPYQLRFKAKVKDSAYGKILETKANLKGTTHAGKELTIEDDSVKINVAYSGKLGFKETPKTLSFKDSFISAYTSTIERKDADWGVSIEDTRAQKQPWNLSVKQVSPFESSEGDKLTQVMIFRKNGIEDKEIDVDNEVDVYSENNPNPNDYFILWQKNEGFFLKVPPGTAKAKQYQTELQWNLKDTPI